MPVLLDREAFEAALPEMAMAAVVLVVTSGMAGLPPLHEETESVVGVRLEDDMEMVGHEAEAQDAHGEFGFGGREQIEEGAIVAVLLKDDHAAIAAVEDMVGVATALSTGWASHYTVRQSEGKKGLKTVTDPLFLTLTPFS